MPPSRSTCRAPYRRPVCSGIRSAASVTHLALLRNSTEVLSIAKRCRIRQNLAAFGNMFNKLWLVFGCNDTDFSDKTFILQNVLRSTKPSTWSLANVGKCWQMLANCLPMFQCLLNVKQDRCEMIANRCRCLLNSFKRDENCLVSWTLPKKWKDQ